MKDNRYRALMVSWACLILIVAMVSCASNSEQRKPSAIKAKSADDVMIDIVVRLKLTEEQRTTVKPIIQSYADRRSDLVISSLQGSGGLKESFPSLRADTEKMMAVILDEAQMKEFRKYMDEEQKAMDESRSGRKGGGRSGGRGSGRGGGFGGGMGGFGR